MSAERRSLVARCWGLAALGACAWMVLKLAMQLLEAWATTKRLADSAVLVARMSQLKPHAFKFPSLGLYLGGFAIVSVLLLGGLWWTGLTNAITDEPDSD